MKLAGDSNLRLAENGVERLNLLLGGKIRTLDQTLEVRAFFDQSREGGEIGGGLFRRPGFLTKREKGLGIAPRHSGASVS